MLPRHSRSTLLVKILVSTMVGAALCQGPCAYAGLRAGISVRNVTPTPLLPVSGGVGPSRPSTRQCGELTVRALVLAHDQTRIAICSTDFLGFPGILASRVRTQVPGIPAKNILIGATHTHSAPDCYGFPDQTGKTSADLPYLDHVCTQLAGAINEAVGSLQPVQIRIATGRAQGKIAYNYYAEQLYDPRCHVLQAMDLQGRAVATLVNYACHPEVLGAGQGILSPDFVGPLYDRIQKQGGGTGIFMNSALGGMVTADCRGPDGKDVQTWAECQRIGHQLADEGLRIINSAPLQKDPQLFCGATTIEFPIESQMMQTILKLSPLGFETTDTDRITTQVNLINVGEAQMLTIPGEALPNIGYYLKRKMQGKHNFLLGLTNDAFGYILTKEDWNSFDRYRYITQTCLGERTGEIFVTKAVEFIHACPRPD